MTDTTRITTRIIADLEQGTRPWHRPGSVEHAEGRITLPLRHSGVPYRGINVVMLWSASIAAGYACPTWGSRHRTGRIARFMARIGNKQVFSCRVRTVAD